MCSLVGQSPCVRLWHPILPPIAWLQIRCFDYSSFVNKFAEPHLGQVIVISLAGFRVTLSLGLFRFVLLLAVTVLKLFCSWVILLDCEVFRVVLLLGYLLDCEQSLFLSDSEREARERKSSGKWAERKWGTNERKKRDCRLSSFRRVLEFPVVQTTENSDWLIRQ